MHNPSLSSACDSISDIWLTLIISWKLLDFLLFCGFYLRGSHDLNAWRAQRTRSRGRRGSSSFLNIISKRIWPFPSWSVLLAAWRGFLAHFGTVWLWYCTTGTVPGSVPGTVPLVLWLLYCIWYCDWYFTNSTVPGTVWLWYCSMGTVTLVLYWWGFLAPTVTLVLCLILCLVLYHFGTALYWWGFGTVPLVLCLVLYQWWDFSTVPGTLVLYHWWGFLAPTVTTQSAATFSAPAFTSWNSRSCIFHKHINNFNQLNMIHKHINNFNELNIIFTNIWTNLTNWTYFTNIHCVYPCLIYTSPCPTFLPSWIVCMCLWVYQVVLI